MLNYAPGPTGERFLASRARVKIICGPVGGGKSTVAAFDLLRRAVQQAPYNGVRRTKALIVRNTSAQLMSTVKPLIDQWFVTAVNGSMGHWHLTDKVFMFRFALPDGTRVESDWVLLPADTPDDVRRLLSVEASFAWVEECREINEEVFRGVRSRTARYPNVATGGVTEPGVICSTNPPSVGSYWHEVMTDVPKGWEVFMQPPAILDDGSLNPEAENIQNLDPGYYESLMEGSTPEWIDVYLKNKFGLGNLGQPVFRSTFRKAFHAIPTRLEAIITSNSPIIVGMDNGLTAAAVIGQQDLRGRVNLLAEAYVPPKVTMGVERFLDNILTPLLRARFPTVRPSAFVFVLDPACFQRSQVNEVTIAQAVAARGYKPVRACTNNPERRVTSVEQLLMRNIDGEPMLRFGEDCPWLIEAMEHGYRFKRQTNGQLSPQVEKNHHSHIAEALQYLCLHYNAAIDPAAAVMKPQAREVKRVAYAYV
jgi:hypothetical protein